MKMSEKQFSFYRKALNVCDNFGFNEAIDYIIQQVKQKNYSGLDGYIVMAEIYRGALDD